MKTEAHLPLSEAQPVIDRIIAAGKISRSDQQRFMSAMLSQNTLGKSEQAQINRIFDLLRAGRLRVVD